MKGWDPGPERQSQEDMLDIAANWAQVLDVFERTIWPIFERRGYGKDAALLVSYGFLGQAGDEDGG